jgi:hypothetical protein
MVEEEPGGTASGRQRTTASRKVGSAAIITLGNYLLLSLIHTGERPQPKSSLPARDMWFGYQKAKAAGSS